jgi:uncharacterized caspase-like protein
MPIMFKLNSSFIVLYLILLLMAGCIKDNTPTPRQDVNSNFVVVSMGNGLNDYGKSIQQTLYGLSKPYLNSTLPFTLLKSKPRGVQIKNKNYLIPTDIKNISLPKVQYRSIPLGYVLSTMETANNDMNIIILDACRDNPFISKYKTLKKGLVVMQNGTDQRGTLIAYATSPNDVAAGSNGRNSPYTKHLLKFIHQPGLPIEMMFKRIRNSVMTETRKQQIPWESSSLYGKDFYFAGKISKKEQKRREEIDTLEKKAKKIQEKLKKLKGKKQIKKIPKKVQKIDKQAERHKRVIPNW